MNRVAAVAIAALLLLSLLRTRGIESPASPRSIETDSGGAARSSSESVDPRAPAGAIVRFEIEAEVAAGESGPPLRLRLRAREGASRPFDVTASESRTRRSFALAVELPIRSPEPPLRAELLDDDWCLPPGLKEFELVRVDDSRRLQLVRARTFDVAVVAESSGAPLAGAELVHESGVKLATTGLDGGARLVRPRGRGGRADDLVLVVAPGFVSAALDESAADPSRSPLPLRALARAGTARGRVLDASGAPVAGALVLPRYELAGELPSESAAVAICRLLAATSARGVAVLTQRSGADGSFEFPLPWPGGLTVTARDRELGRASASLRGEGLADAGRITELELRFAPPFELRVTATRGGRPFQGGAIEIVERDVAGPTAIAAALTGSDGRASLRAAAAGTLWMVARADGLAPQIVELAGLAADATRGVDASVAFEEGSGVTFVVGGFESLEPHERVVQWRDAASGFLLGEQPIDFQGRVRLDHLPAARRLELVVATGGPSGTKLRELELPKEGAESGRSSPPASPAEIDLGVLPLRSGS